MKSKILLLFAIVLVLSFSLAVSFPASAAPGTGAEIITYRLPGKTQAAVINSQTGTIDVTVAHNTNVTNLVAIFTTSDDIASIKVGGVDQVSGKTANDFSNPVTYTVTAQDKSTTKNWVVTVVLAPSAEAEIINYRLAGETIPPTSNSSKGSVISSSDNGATWSDYGWWNFDAVFKEEDVNQVVYENNTVGTYYDSFGEDTFKGQSFTPSITHTVTRIELSLAKQGNPSGNVVISIKATDANGLPTGSDLATSRIACAAIISGSSKLYKFDLTTGVTVIAGTRYCICMQAPGSDLVQNVIMYYLDINNPYSDGIIAVTMAPGTDVTNLVATFSASADITSIKVGAVDQVSGKTANDFSKPVTYTLTAQDGSTTKNWVVIVSTTTPPPSPTAPPTPTTTSAPTLITTPTPTPTPTQTPIKTISTIVTSVTLTTPKVITTTSTYIAENTTAATPLITAPSTTTPLTKTGSTNRSVIGYVLIGVLVMGFLIFEIIINRKNSSK